MQATRKKLSFDRHLLDLDSAISVSDGKPPIEQWFDDWIIPPPWCQTDREFFEAYWKIIKERNSATISDQVRNVPESVLRFMRAVRYPLRKIHLMLFKGELVARGDDKGFGERKLIPSLFWRREDMRVDFQYSNIYSAAGELIWGDISLEAAASGGEVIGQSANIAEVTGTRKNTSVVDESQYEPVPDAIRRKFKELSKLDAASMRAKITVRNEVIWNALMQEPQFSKMAKPSPNTFGNALSKIDRRRKTKR